MDEEIIEPKVEKPKKAKRKIVVTSEAIKSRYEAFLKKGGK